MSLYLPEPVFAHGQLYVACGRVGSKDNLSIYIVDGKTQGYFSGYEGVYTRNVVYKEVFDDKYGCQFSVNDAMSQEVYTCSEEYEEELQHEVQYNDYSSDEDSSDEDIDMNIQQYSHEEDSSDEDIDLDNQQYSHSSESSSDITMEDHQSKCNTRTQAQRDQSRRDKREMDANSESE